MKLNEKRKTLYKLINSESLFSEQVLKISVEIDHLILEYYREDVSPRQRKSSGGAKTPSELCN